MENSKIKAFEEYLMEDEKSENTISTYTDSLKKYFSIFPEITKQNMIEYKRQMLAEFSPKTAANRCIAMNQYCEFVGMPECKVKSIKIHKHTSVENVITLDEYFKLLKCLEEDQREKEYWMIQFLAKTGARVSEFVRFERKHLEKGEIKLWTKGKIRKILIPTELIDESRNYFQKIPENLYMFPNRYGKQMSTRGVAEMISRCGKYGIRKEVLHPHSFRHLYAIQFLKNNGNIALLADLMGHESIDTTSIYLKLSAREQKSQFDQAMRW